MAEYVDKLRDKKFQNWVKSSLGLCITREGVLPLVTKVVEEFHKESLRGVLSPVQIERSEFCTKCQTGNILECRTKGFCTVRAGKCLTHDKEKCIARLCPSGICHLLRDAIIKGHSFHHPSWKNTHAEKWCQCPWEIAKCYMPPDGYLETSSIAETDLNGLLSVMSNLKRFVSTISKEELNEVRDIGRQLRHCSDFSVDVATMNEYLDKMILFLTSSDDLVRESKEAVINLKKLKSNDLVICTEDVTKLLQDTINENIKFHPEECKERKDQYLQDIKDVLAKGVGNESKLLSDILTARREVLEDIEKAKQTSIQEINNLQKYSSCSNDDHEQRKSEFKEDLITFYHDVHNSIRVSPLVPHNDAPILDFYVQRRMESVDLKRASESRKSINSYKELFTEESRNIYIVAQAGVGKTTFMKRLCAVWCFSQQKDGKKPDGLADTSVEVLKQFEFLFLVLLADVQDECDVDDMIESQIVANLSRSRKYNKDFMEHLFHHAHCLVLLDGVDEWSHPKGVQCSKMSPIPHRRSRKKWKILSTSRPWKIHNAELSNCRIDKYVELAEHDKTSVLKLAEKVISILDTDKKGEKPFDDFIKETEEKGITELTYTPVLLIQMICLWHDDRPLGTSKCQIYSNIIEFILERGKAKLQSCSHLSTPEDDIGFQLDTADYLREHANMKYYYSLLVYLGKFAFKALTSEIKESSLVFGQSMTEDCLSKEQLQICLHVGLLTESCIHSYVSQHVSTFSFIHKTFQEYFCALYLATLHEDKCAEKFSTMCKSVENILEMSNVIVFLSGLRPNMLSCISNQLRGVIANDSLTLGFRCSIGTAIEWESHYKQMKWLQGMYISCVEEHFPNVQDIQIHLEDIFIDSDCQNQNVQESMKTLIGMNTKVLKSIKMYDCQVMGGISLYVKRYNLQHVRTLERLEIIGHLEEEELIHMLSESAETLTCISLCKDLRRYGQMKDTMILTPVKSLNIIQNMPCLEALMLECFKLPHSQLDSLFACISKRHTMKQIGLGFLHCSDHEGKCSGFDINLSEHSCLQKLQLGVIPLTDVTINTNVLEVCRVGKFHSSSLSDIAVHSKVFNSLRGAKSLRELMCFDFESLEDVLHILDTLPLLEQLQAIVFKRMDFKDRPVILPLGITHIKFCDSKLSAIAFQKLVHESDNIPVRFELLECRITPDDEYGIFKTKVKASKMYTLWCDELIHGSEKQFEFTKDVKGRFGDE